MADMDARVCRHDRRDGMLEAGADGHARLVAAGAAPDIEHPDARAMRRGRP
jgi:hypothetical protein